MKILVTGANGFVGQHFCQFLHMHNIPFTALIRTPTDSLRFQTYLCDLSRLDQVRSHIQGITHIIHLAGRAHCFDANNQQAEKLYFSSNVETTSVLIEAALEKKVPLFYLSSVKVNGELGHFKITDPPSAEDLYAQSKLQAEQRIIQASQLHGLSYHIIRPTLIYGQGAKGNLARLMSAIYYGLPLPFAHIQNARSMIHVDNLSALLLCLIQQTDIKNTCLFAADFQTLSTPELIKILAEGLEKPAHLFPFPLNILKAIAKITQKSDFLDRITGSLTVDLQPLHDLNYQEAVDTEKGLIQMAQAFKQTKIKSSFTQ